MPWWELLEPAVADRLLGRDTDPAEVLERDEIQQQVDATLAALRARVADRNYQVFCLQRIEGLPESKVANRLGLKVLEVRYRLHRTKQHFRELYRRLYG
jgi:DNA-directed RNA polymerase specialized sigma24 family protein